MKVTLEVFRNTPMGRNCRTLSRNVAEAVAASVDKDIEVSFLPLASPEAEARGVELAPCLVINRRTIVEGVPTPEEIAQLIEKATPVALGIVLTRAPHSGGEAESALNIAREALGAGDGVSLFLLSDGVWLARKGQDSSLPGQVVELLRAGGEVLVSQEHLKAAGLEPEQLLEGVTLVADPLDGLVERVMEHWDKVIVF